MPRVKPGERKRAYRPKTRSGCRTCKTRRIKCDEAFPFCQRCVSTGRKCDGYEDTTQTITATSLPSKWSRHQEPLNDGPSSRISIRISTNETERRAFHFFTNETIPQLAGFYQCEFWERLLLQAVHADPGIRHAVLALSSLHESFENGETYRMHLGQNTDRTRFFLQQYNLAIKQLLIPPAQQTQATVEMYLASCIVFICIETLKGYHKSAAALIAKGTKMLCELRALQRNRESRAFNPTPSQLFDVPLEVFELIFIRFEAQAVALLGPGNFEVRLGPEFTNQPDDIPEVFPKLMEARNSLEYHWHKFIYQRIQKQEAMRQAGLNPVHHYRKQFFPVDLDPFFRWSRAFDAFLELHGDSLTPKEQIGATILEIRKLTLYTSVAKYIEQPMVDDQTQWDKHQPIFEKIVTLSETVANAELASEEFDAAHRPRFSLDVGIVGPLFDIAHRCRDPYIRRNAIRLLRLFRRHEGIWDGTLAARILERIIMIEEDGLGNVTSCADIPDSARLSGVLPSFDTEERRAVLTYSRPFGTPDIGKLNQVVITW